MSKYGPAIEKQIDNLITFMESRLIGRKFTPTESANIREVIYTVVHTAQLEAVGAIRPDLKNTLNEDPTVRNRKLEETLESMKWIWQSPAD
jgi:hypothetical protein